MNVYSDGDHEERSESGVVSVTNLKELEKRFKEIGITKARIEDKSGNVVVYKLPWKYTEKDIERFWEQNTAKKQRYNHVVLAENINPTLFVNLNELLRACYENVRRLEPVARDAFGRLILEVCAEMLRCYMEMGNGRMEEETGMNYIRKSLNKVKGQAKILSDLKLWNARTYARVGEVLIRTQDIVDAHLKGSVK